MKLEVAILNALLANEEPSSTPLICHNVGELTGSEPTQTDVLLALRRLEKDGMVKGTQKVFAGAVWKDTEKGRLAVA